MAKIGLAEIAVTLETGDADRGANMTAFARRALELLLAAVHSGTT